MREGWWNSSFFSHFPSLMRFQPASSASLVLFCAKVTRSFLCSVNVSLRSCTLESTACVSLVLLLLLLLLLSLLLLFVCLFCCFYNCIVGISPLGNSGCFPRGKSAATESRYPSYGACRGCSSFSLTWTTGSPGRRNGPRGTYFGGVRFGILHRVIILVRAVLFFL